MSCLNLIHLLSLLLTSPHRPVDGEVHTSSQLGDKGQIVFRFGSSPEKCGRVGDGRRVQQLQPLFDGQQELQ